MKRHWGDFLPRKIKWSAPVFEGAERDKKNIRSILDGFLLFVVINSKNEYCHFAIF